MAYARAIRQIIADQGEFQLLDYNVEDKYAYKRLMREKPSQSLEKSNSVSPINSSLSQK